MGKQWIKLPAMILFIFLVLGLAALPVLAENEEQECVSDVPVPLIESASDPGDGDIDVIDAVDKAILALQVIKKITLDDEPAVAIARALVDYAKSEHAATDEDFQYLPFLVAAEKRINKLVKDMPTPPIFGKVIGTVTDQLTAAPLENAYIRLRTVSEAVYGSAYTGEDGRYEVTMPVIAGYIYVVEAFADGYVDAAEEDVVVEEDKDQVVDFAMESGYTIVLDTQPAYGGTVAGAGTFSKGSPVTIEATPYPGYRFVDWTVNGTAVSDESSYTFTTTSDLRITANFTLAAITETQPLGALEIGARVLDPRWGWEHRTAGNYMGTGVNKPVTWVVVAKDHYGPGSGVTLLSEELIGLFAFDNSTHLHEWGHNHWGESGTHSTATSGLRPWLNSTGIHGGEGFYNAFSPFLQNAVVEVTLPNKAWESGVDYPTTDKVFIPSTTELGDPLSSTLSYPIGEAYSYFVGADDAKRAAPLGSFMRWYWTRSPGLTGVSGVCTVRFDGAFGIANAGFSWYGVRPALNLQTATPVSANLFAGGVYILGEMAAPPPGSDADLSALVVDPGTLNPGFDPAITAYTVNVGHDVSSIALTATLSDAGATMTIDGAVVESGDTVTLTLGAVGAATGIDIVVTAEDGVTEKAYSVTVNRAEDPLAQEQVIYVQNRNTGAVRAWIIAVDPANVENTFITGTIDIGSAPAPKANWMITTAQDIDGSGSPDLIWHNSATGVHRVWKMDGLKKAQELNYGPQYRSNLKVVDLHDMDGDGKPDAILQNPAGGRFIWFMNGHNQLRQERLAFAHANWNIAGVADMGSDGKTNLIWEHKLVGGRNYWTLNESYTRIPTESGNFHHTGNSWKIVAINDMDGDGSPDLVWEHQGNGNRALWLVDSMQQDFADMRTGTFTQEPVAWTIVGAGTLAGEFKLPDPAPAPEPDFAMVAVGTSGTTYTIPTGTADSGTAQVIGGYHIAATTVTYELWYEVRLWAEARGYRFQNRGMEGSVTGGGDWPNYNNLGKPPTNARKEPVTMVNWRDSIVWLNALSEKYGLAPVYRTADGSVIKDARDSNAKVVDSAVQTNHNGYRLPTSMEWEMAARWKNDPSSTHGSIERGGRWWTPGNYASGATASYTNAAATGAVAWYRDNSDTGRGRKTHPVGLKKANALGLYDMSGNVWEWCFDRDPGAGDSARVLRSGGFGDVSENLRLGLVISLRPSLTYANDSFRMARTP